MCLKINVLFPFPLRFFNHSLDLTYPNLTKPHPSKPNLAPAGGLYYNIYILALAGATASSDMNPSPCGGQFFFC